MTRDSVPDPAEIDNKNSFGAALTLLREQAGLTVRDIARAVGIPAATAGDYFAGRSLPPLKMAEVLPAIVRACGIADPVQVDQWRMALIRARRESRGDSKVPYRGLSTYERADAEWFFGRAQLVTFMVRRLNKARSAGIPLTVLGVSGSGKSSLLRAGVAATLAADGYVPLLVTPGRNPCRGLADQLAVALRMPVELVDHVLHTKPQLIGDLTRRLDRAALIVDQLEELFIARSDVTIQQTFLSAVDALSQAGMAVTLGVRADCLAFASRQPLLRRSLDEAVLVGQLDEDGLRQAIVGPARLARVEVAPELVDRLLADFDAAARSRVPAEPAGVPADPLPLLSHALLATWRHRRRGPLSLADYLATGGLTDCVRRSAELTLDSLNPAQRELARGLFRALVNRDDRTARVRRRVPRAELHQALGARQARDIDLIVDRFAAQRLLTAAEGTVEITHDALLRAWPRVTAWLADGARNEASDRGRLAGSELETYQG